MEYVRINKEYDFVKKRALVNFLTNSRTELEHHFHGRAQNMLSSIERYEQANLRLLLNGIGKGAVDKINAAMANPTESASIKEKAFQAALTGIREGVMTYKNDPIFPILNEEINNRVNAYKALSSEDESKLLSLNGDQKKAVTDSDKRDKQAFLAIQPNINDPGVKGNEKYKSYVESTKASGH
jgi:hypothetical protein